MIKTKSYMDGIVVSIARLDARIAAVVHCFVETEKTERYKQKE